MREVVPLRAAVRVAFEKGSAVGVEEIVVPAVLVGAPLMTVVGLVLLGIRRKARLSRRARIPFQGWSSSLGIRSPRTMPVCEKVLEALAEQLGVDPAQLRPEDSFDVDYSMAPAWVGLPNHLVDDFLDDVARILWEEGVRNWARYSPRRKTLGDLLVHVDAVLTELPAA